MSGIHNDVARNPAIAANTNPAIQGALVGTIAYGRASKRRLAPTNRPTKSKTAKKIATRYSRESQ